MTSIDTDRTHSSTLTAKAAQWAAQREVKGFASKATALRSMGKNGLTEQIAKDGLAAHFAFVTITEGKHAGRVIPTLGFEAGAQVPSLAAWYAHKGITVICF